MLFYFGDYDGARDFFEDQRHVLGWPDAAFPDNLAAVALVEGDPYRARALYGLFPPKPRREPFRWNAYAVATALSGERERAVELLDKAIKAGAGEVGLSNRGAVRASLGQLDVAESDLRKALDLDARLAPAWNGLAKVLERTGRSREAAVARASAVAAAAAGPRRHPYGIPDGLGQYPSWKLDLRWILWLDAEDLLLARAPFRAADAIAMRDRRELFASKPHLALIVIDTLRADHLGAYGYPRATSPRIDRLAREGVRFANASATSSWTLPSVASLFTSRSPTAHKASSWGRHLQPDAVTFVQRLNEVGYRTLGVSGNFVHVTKKAGFARGFDTWKTLSHELDETEADTLFLRKSDGARLRAPTAREINATVFDHLPAADDAPLFLYVHYMEPHSGYDPPERHRLAFVTDPAAHAGAALVTSAYLTELVRKEREIDAGEHQRLIDLYDAEIAAVDQAIGELLDGLEAQGFGDKLVVAVVSDHGEEFGEHGSWFHGLTLHGESLAVPLVIWDSRRSGPGVVLDDPVDLLDVPTTFLALAGVDPAVGMRGRNLLSDGSLGRRGLLAALEPDPLFEEHVLLRSHRRALTRWPWKVIVDRKWDAQVYQLERDPGEAQPMALSDSEVPAAIRMDAQRLAQKPPPQPEGSRSQRRERGRRPSKADREGLRALGYAE
jgi:arylsulfatase